MARGTAVITGGSSGIGAEFAHQLAARGYDLLLVARRRERLAGVCDEIKATHKVDCSYLVADLARDADLRVVEQRLGETPALELLVNNAGFGTLGRFYDVPLAQQDYMHRVHVIAIMRLCHAVLPGLVKRDRGGIINVSSIAASWPMAGATNYCATKAWVKSFTEALHLELKESNSHVKLQALCPGLTRTEFHQAMKMDSSGFPNLLWLPVDRVVRESLCAFDRGALIVTPSRRYRLLLILNRLFPRMLRQAIASKSSRTRRRLNEFA